MVPVAGVIVRENVRSAGSGTLKASGGMGGDRLRRRLRPQYSLPVPRIGTIPWENLFQLRRPQMSAGDFGKNVAIIRRHRQISLLEQLLRSQSWPLAMHPASRD